MLNISHNQHTLFKYDTQHETLECTYCQRSYSFNNSKLRTSFLNKIQHQSGDVTLNTVLFRCIMCDLTTPNYPIKLRHYPYPNDEQTKIIIELYQQLLITCQSDYTHYMFLLEGVAGTGKTSTIMSLFKYPEFDQFKICFSAPTNKALNVMMEKLGDSDDDNTELHDNAELHDNVETLMSSNTLCTEKRVKRTFITVFKLLGSKTSINATGETTFETQDTNDLTFQQDFIIIDEISMIETKQIKTLLSSVINQKERSVSGSHPVIIFMGDLGQLPPVTEDSSIIFDHNIQNHYHIRKLTLMKIMRSNDRLTNLSQNIRQLIPLSPSDETQKPHVEHIIPCVDLSKFTCSQIKYFSNRDQWLKEYSDIFKKNLHGQDEQLATQDTHMTLDRNRDAPIILVYTNSECDSLNNECRNLIFNYPQDPYVIGELLIFKSYYCLQRQRLIDPLPPERKMRYYLKFYTSEQFIMTGLTNLTTVIDPFTFPSVLGTIDSMTQSLSTWIKGKVSQSQTDYIDSELKRTLSKWSFDSSTRVIVTQQPALDMYLNKITTQINKIKHVYAVNDLAFDSHLKLDPLDCVSEPPVIRIIAKQSANQYLINCDKTKTIIKSNYQNLLITFKNNKIIRLLIDFIFQNIWRFYYYRRCIWPFADVVYGYAITSHKSQGSTYKNTFINIGNIMGCQKVNAIVRSKSLYTSMTRASDTINILNQRQLLLPVTSTTQTFICHICHKSSSASLFPPNNYVTDKKCADHILNQIKPLCVHFLGDFVILIDKFKNLYKIPKTELQEYDLNDAYEYVIKNNMLKPEINRYQDDNLNMIQLITSSPKS
jgi:hypothetical protein